MMKIIIVTRCGRVITEDSDTSRIVGHGGGEGNNMVLESDTNQSPKYISMLQAPVSGPG